MHFISITLYLFILAAVKGSFLSLFGKNRLKFNEQNVENSNEETPKLTKNISKQEKKISKDEQDLFRLSKQDDIQIESLKKYTT